MSNESQKSFPLWGFTVCMLTLILITLKLTGEIALGWIWVLSPLWLPTISVLSVGLFAVSIYCVVSLIKKAVGK